MRRVMFAELSSQPLKIYDVNSVGLKSNFGSKKPFSLTDTLSVQSLMHPLKQCVNTFKNKVSLSIHPTDAAPRRSMGFLDRFDKFSKDLFSTINPTLKKNFRSKVHQYVKALEYSAITSINLT
jgi:hypothetical protein